MKTIFADPTARWVPFATAAIIVASVWGGSVWQDYDVGVATRFAVGLTVVMLIAIVLQGRLFWKGQVAGLDGDGQRYEAVTSVWVGRGRRVAFTAGEATDWTATSRSASKAGEAPRLGTIYFTVRGQRLDMSFVNPKRVDLAGLTALNPGYFAKVKADYPGLQSTA